LQHGGVLAFTQPGEQYNLPVGELERIVMRMRFGLVDPPETGRCRCSFALWEHAKHVPVLNFLFERDFCARENAYRHIWLSNRREAAS